MNVSSIGGASYQNNSKVNFRAEAQQAVSNIKTEDVNTGAQKSSIPLLLSVATAIGVGILAIRQHSKISKFDGLLNEAKNASQKSIDELKTQLTDTSTKLEELKNRPFFKRLFNIEPKNAEAVTDNAEQKTESRFSKFIKKIFKSEKNTELEKVEKVDVEPVKVESEVTQEPVEQK